MGSDFAADCGARILGARITPRLPRAFRQWRAIACGALSAALGATYPALVYGALLPDSLRPFVTAGVEHDDNLFRDSSNEESETIASLGAGIDINLNVSLQRINGRLAFAERRYDTNDYLDYTKADGALRWNWSVGSNWTGLLAQEYTRDLRSFVDNSNRQREIRVAATTAAEMVRRIGAEWQLKVDFNYYVLDYQETHTLDRVTTSFGTEMQYKTSLDSYVGLRVSMADTAFPNDQIVDGDPVNSDYREELLALVGGWKPSTRSWLRAYIGRSRLEYDAFPTEDVTGRRYRMSFGWDPSEKLDMKISVWQELNPRDIGSENERASAVESLGANFEPRWRLTSLVTLRARLSGENRRFTGELDRLSNGEQREEDVFNAGLGAVYRLNVTRNGVDLTADVARAVRISNDVAYDYNSTRWLLGLRAGF